MSFAERLVRERKQAGLSQEVVAKALHLTRPTYANLELGLRAPSLEEVKRISELFGVRIEELVSDIDLPEKEPADPIASSSKIAINQDKYKNVLLYVLGKIGARPNVGETVIYKLIYFIETNSLLLRGNQIIGESFIKLQYGPVPAKFKVITDEMTKADELDIATGQYFTFRQKKYLPRVNADMSSFSKEDIEVIDNVVDKLGTLTATDLSDLSHRDLPWIEAEINRTIDLSLAKKRNSQMKEIVGA